MIESSHENKEDGTCGISSSVSYCVDDEILEENISGRGSGVFKGKDKRSKKVSS